MRLPDGNTITASHAAMLPLSQKLSQEASTAFSFQSIANPLISIGKLCDDDCVAIFTKEQCYVLKSNHVHLPAIQTKAFMKGNRDHDTKLWTFALHPSPPPFSANTIFEMKLKELITFHHKSMFSPTKDTWLKAIKKGYFTTWHGITYTSVNKHLQLTEATAKGHMRQQHQNYRSTKLHQKHTNSIEMTAKQARTNAVYVRPIEATGLLCTDQTGAFPVTSTKSNRYIMVAHHYDSNAILVRPLPSRSQYHLQQAFTSIYDTLSNAGHQPTEIRLDNEAPMSLRKYFKKRKMNFQLVPPNNHRRNYAEKAINTFKNHFIAGLCTLHKHFPLDLWCSLLPHAEITLNMLRTSNLTPNISAYTELHGEFNYDKTPILPPGLKLIIHEKPSQRKTWSPRGTEGWYLGPALNHYRCHRVFCTKTQAERITETINIIPDAHTPQISLPEAAIIATEKLTETLAAKDDFGQKQLDSIQQLAKALQHLVKENQSLQLRPLAITHKPIIQRWHHRGWHNRG